MYVDLLPFYEEALTVGSLRLRQTEKLPFSQVYVIHGTI